MRAVSGVNHLIKLAVLAGLSLITGSCGRAAPRFADSGVPPGKAGIQADKSNTASVPQYAYDQAEKDKKEFLSKNALSASGFEYRFFYKKDGSACLEYTVIPKSGYTWPNSTWTGYIWGNESGSIGNNEIKYTLTKEKADEAQRRLEERRKDAAFREIEKIVLEIATEYDYDFYSAYRISAKYRDPKTKKAVCDGYADAVVRALSNHRLVAKVEKWTGHNHAWNVIVLKDGRKLYCDATWYDGNKIDEQGYVVHVPAETASDLTFDRDEFNSLGGAIDRSTGKPLAVHFAARNVELQKKK